ncbi:hypothetical protein [Aquimarina sp. AU119]|uniref:hypothetical protein n=1 Tax=Aquimarina sp. AU119 TaxID=2108528 RepID=UPI000D69BBFC|nr:hypothetical protein [Aquimarina sp. AU119]
MNFTNYLFRASQIGKIMSGIPKPLTQNQIETFEAYQERKNGNGKPLTEKQEETFIDLRRKKNAKCQLTDGSKTYLEKLVWEELTGRKQNLKVKYLDKGIQVEERSITVYSKIKKKFFVKNKIRMANKYFTGEPDNVQGKVRDIKSSWEYETFPLTDHKITNSDYEWQVQVYMNLFDLKEAELIYCLVDTPEKLINDEIRRMDWKFDLFNGSGEVKEECIPLVVELISNHIYTIEGLKQFCNNSTFCYLKWFEGIFKEIPEEIRVKIFEFTSNEKMIAQAKEMVLLSRSYMNQILEKIGSDIMKNSKLLKLDQQVA